MLKQVSLFFKKIPLLSEKKLFLLIFISAFVIRFAYTLTMENRWYYYDTVHWDKAASAILNGEGFGTGYSFSSLGFDKEYSLEPAYPIFLAGIYGVFGRNFLIVRIFQCLMGAAVCYLVFLIGAKVFNRNAGIIASAIAAFYPLHIFISGMLYPTLLFTFFIAMTIFSLLKIDESESYLYPILAGLFLALATQTIPIIFAFYPFAAFWLLAFVKKPHAQRWKHLLVTFSIAFLALLPWTIRNYLVFGKIVPVRASFSDQLLKVKVNVDSDMKVDLYKDDVKNSGIGQTELGRQIESMQSKNFWNKISSVVLDNPRNFLKRYIGEFFHFWIFYPDPDRVITKNKYLSPFTKWVSIFSFSPIFLFSIIGLFGSKRVLRNSILLVFIIFSLVLAYSFFITQMRYRIPIEPYMIIFAGIGLIISIEKFNKILTKKPVLRGGPSQNRSQV